MSRRISSACLRDLHAKRICLIKPSALGDVVQTLPLIEMLRSRFPTATISWVVQREFADLLTGHPDLSEIIPFHRDGGWRAFLRLLKVLRDRRFDLVLDVQGLSRSAIMTLATRAALRVGLESAREGASLAYNCVIPDSGWGVPAHVRYWRIADTLGMATHPRVALVPTSASDTAAVDDLIRLLPRPVMALHPGAGWPTKRWPVEKFAEIARRFPGSFVVVGSKAERALAERLIELAAPLPKPALNLAGRTTLKQLAALLRAVDLVVSNDSGPMHLAGAVGTPLVGIFTCTSPMLSGPAGTNHDLVSTGVPCAASYREACPYRGKAHLACLAELPVERVWQAVQRVLERRRAA